MRYLLCLLLLCAVNSKAQLRVSYHDYDWKEVSDSKKARFYRENKKSDSGWVQHDFYVPSLKTSMAGLYSDEACQVKNGRFVWYYPNGKLKTIARYKNNNKTGLYLSFHPNGALKDSLFFKDDKLVGSGISVYADGMLSDSLAVVNDSTLVEYTWFRNGQLASAGLYRNGKRHGRWKYYDNMGTLVAIVEYENDEEQGSQYLNKAGEVILKPDNATEEARFKSVGGNFGKYVTGQLNWPSDATLGAGEEAVVVVDFWVDEEGKVIDAEVTVPLHPSFDEIALKAVRLSPKWLPARAFNRAVASHHRQPILFAMPED
jgi:TonB family protein